MHLLEEEDGVHLLEEEDGVQRTACRGQRAEVNA